MVLNVVDRLLPTSVTAVIMTTAIKDAIRPYSIAVTPFLLETAKAVAKACANRFIMYASVALNGRIRGRKR